MKLEHIALNISNLAEINDFYHNILGMKEERTFVLNKDLADKIFGIPMATSVFFMQKDNLFIEIFVSTNLEKQNFNHICMSIKNREMLVEKACKKNYECSRIEKDPFDIIFIKDKYGNIFEIKES